MGFAFNALSGQFDIVSSSGGGSGDVVGPNSSIDSEVALFSGTTGKLLKRATGTGFAKLTSGVLSAGSIAGSDLPNPSSTTLGGVRSAAAVSHQWINSISTSGIPALSQPAFTDISGSVAATQLPNPSASTLGGVQSAAAVTNQWINSISTSGVPALSQPAFTDISGAATVGQLPTVTIAKGGTGQTTAAAALTALGGATMALDNLVSTQINADLLFPSDGARNIGSKTARAQKLYSKDFATNDDTTTTQFARLSQDAYNGNPGIIFGASTTASTWGRMYVDGTRTMRINFNGTDTITISPAGINSTVGGQWGAFGTGYNLLNLYGAFSWNNVQSNTGASNFTITDGICVIFVTNSGGLAALQVTMPANPASNMPVKVIFQGAVTTLTWAGGTFAVTPPATATAGQVMSFIYRGADSKYWPY